MSLNCSTEFYLLDCKCSLNLVRTNLNLRFVVCLAAFSILWSLGSCRAINIADSLQNNDRNVWKISSRRKVLDWYGIFKLQSFDKNNIHAKTSSLEQNILDSNENTSDRRAISLQRYDWWWLKTTSTTEAPYKFDNTRGNPIDGSVFFLILFPMIAGVIIIICKYYLCEDTNCTVILCKECCDRPISQDVQTSRTSQSRRLNYSSPTQRSRLPERSNPRPQIFLTRSWNGNNSSSPSSLSRGAQTAQNNTNSVVDKPPGYSDVVLADFSAGLTEFPGVKSNGPESPPPRYDEENMKY